MKKVRTLSLMILALGTMTTLVAALPFQDPKPAAPKPPAGDEGKREKAAESSPDQSAITEAAQAFVKAYNGGDAKAVAALFSEGAEILRDHQAPIKGRAEIQELFEGIFADSPGATISLDDTEVRLITPDLAIEEGAATIEPKVDEGEAAAPIRSRYIIHYAKTGGKWLQASVRDVPDRDPTVEERLQELSWMVGDWIDEGQDGLFETNCRWDSSGRYIIREFTMKLAGEPRMSGTERIGWDPLTKQIKSWVFDSEGGYGESLWTKSGDEWLMKARGVLPDGRVATATRTLTRVSKDVARISSTDRVAGGEMRPDVDEIILVRRPPAPKPRASATKPASPEPAATKSN